MDQNTPARFLDTAYDALKANPNATNQILQAAAKGAPVGLRGLAAAAAQQSQQQAQQAMAALRQQGAQPNIVQKLAHAGIMSQMDTGLPGAAQMAPQEAPQEMPPQMMAGGGLVSFAEGGGVLPPDVIDAIQSHFASGGDVRGFAGGDEIMSLLRGAAEDIPYGEMGSFIEGPGATPRAMPADYGPMGSFIEGEPRRAPSRLDLLKKFLEKEVSPADIESAIASKAKGVASKGLGAISKYGSALGALGKVAGPVGYAASLYDVGNTISDPQNQANFSEDWKREMSPYLGGDTFEVNPAISREELDRRRASRQKAAPAETTGALDYDLSKNIQPKESSIEKAVRTSFENPEKSTWQPERHDEHEVKPSARVPDEAAKLDKPFKEAKTDVPSAAVTPDSEAVVAKGLEALGGGNLEQMRDLISGLRGHKELSPEMSQRLADIEDKARTSTIIQSVLGALGGGLTDPYGGRFALGRAALGALSGYQKGVGSEEEIGRKGFDILRGYSDAPAEEQAKSADELLNIFKERMKLQSAADIAENKGQDALYRFLMSEEGKNYRYGQGKPANEAQLAQIQNLAVDNARKTIDAENKKRASSIPAQKPLSQLEEQDILKQEFARQQQFIQSGGTNIGLGANISAAQSSGLGGGTTPPIFRRQP